MYNKCFEIQQHKELRRSSWTACSTSYHEWTPTVQNWTTFWLISIAGRWVCNWPLSRPGRRPTRWRSTWRMQVTRSTISGLPAISWARTCFCGWVRVFRSMPHLITCWRDLGTEPSTCHRARNRKGLRGRGNVQLTSPSTPITVIFPNCNSAYRNSLQQILLLHSFSFFFDHWILQSKISILQYYLFHLTNF